MRSLCLLILIICMGSIVSISAQQSNECDKRCLDSVRYLLSDSKLAGGQPYFSTWSEKAAHRLGDGVTVGILKIYRKRDLTKPQTIRIFLPVIRESFLYPDIIERQEDKKAEVSLTFLRELENEVKDDLLRRDISELRKLILEKTASLSTVSSN